MTSTAPAVIGVISFVFLRELLTMRSALDIALSVAGVLVINLLNVSDTRGPSPLLRNHLVFGAVVEKRSLPFSAKSCQLESTPLRGQLIGLVLFFPFALIEGLQFDLRSVTPLGWFLISYHAIMVTAAGFALWYRGVSKVPGSTAAVFSAVMPVSAVLLSFMILSEPLSWVHNIGLVSVVGGIVMIAL